MQTKKLYSLKNNLFLKVHFQFHECLVLAHLAEFTDIELTKKNLQMSLGIEGWVIFSLISKALFQPSTTLSQTHHNSMENKNVLNQPRFF